MRLFLGFLLAVILMPLQGQTKLVTGEVKDATTGEPLIGANVVYGPGQGTAADLNGKFRLQLQPGDYSLTVSYVGYDPVEKQVTVGSRPLYLEIFLESMTIDEVVVTADVAISRKTPVAFSNVNPAQIQEELAGQDLPMILNTTPGVYATQQGGGDGDARITIRGFDQRNLAVMIDGIPVNDMENGWVYWSNWFGLDAVTRTMQVQRGLGASQLALPSVGGTINILTKGIENRRETTIKQSIDSQGKLQTNFGFTSGKLPNGWGVTLAGAYKKGDGWVDNTYSEGWFYYFKVDKRFKKHLITLTGMGAPQMHDQRTYKKPISAFDLDYAESLGVDVESLDTLTNYRIYDRGVQYNPFWGMLSRNKDNPDADTVPFSARTNQYHKPQFTLRDFWTISDRLSLSTNLYVSLGKGGGDRPSETIKDTRLIDDPESPYYGQIDWQQIYEENFKGQPPFYTPPIAPEYSSTLTVPNIYMIRRHNDHNWYGLLSKLNYRISESLSFSGGIDLRSYQGIHYTTVVDLLGGDYVIDKNDKRRDISDPTQEMKFKGDTIDYFYEGLVRWGGYYAQLEYSANRLSTFLNVTSAVSGYKKVDYFEMARSDWRYKSGFTVKTGGNYNLTDNSSIFLNLGYLSKVRSFRDFFVGFTTEFQENVENEIVRSIEAGYNFKSPRFSVFLNSYYTRWENRPTSMIRSRYNLQPGDPGYSADDQEANEEKEVYAIIPGLDARHMGLEVDFAYKLLHNLEFQGTVSLGDWIWDSYVEDVPFYLDETNEPVQKVIDIDTRGIHVSDAAQMQLGSNLRYTPFKGLYINVRQTYFDKFYSRFEAESTTDAEGNVKDSWKMPSFNLLDLHAGYNFKLGLSGEKVRYNLRFSMLNIMDATYIWGAENNDGFGPYSSLANFDAASATVFFGMGRRFTTSFSITF